MHYLQIVYIVIYVEASLKLFHVQNDNSVAQYQIVSETTIIDVGEKTHWNVVWLLHMCKVINFGDNVVVKKPTNVAISYAGINRRHIKINDNYKILQIIVSMSYEIQYQDRTMTNFLSNFIHHHGATLLCFLQEKCISIFFITALCFIFISCYNV